MPDLIQKQFEPSQMQAISESCAQEIEVQVVESLCRIITEALRLPWSVRSEVSRILHTAIEKDTIAVLNSYKEYSLEYYAHQIQRHFGIPKNQCVQPEWSFGDHAKLSPVFKKMDEWLKKPEEERKAEQL